MLISTFPRGAAGLVLKCSRCLKIVVLWWFLADFTIFEGVWFCCFSTSTDVRFCLTRFSIRMFALPENVRFMVVSVSFHFFSRALAAYLLGLLIEFYHRPINPGYFPLVQASPH